MSEWQATTVGEVASGFLSGGTPTTKRHDYWDGEIPWITSKWLGEKVELTTGEKFVSKEAVEKTSTKIVPKDSIIFATRVGVGKVGINRIDLAINQDLAGVLIDNERYDLKFLAYQLGVDSIQQYIAMNKRGATIKGITRDCLSQIRLNIPPLPEQKKIAHILSTVQRAIQAQERIIQTTIELKKALMHKLFTEGFRNEPQKQTKIGPVPESWDVVELGDHATFKNGVNFSKKEKDGDGILTVDVKNMYGPGCTVFMDQLYRVNKRFGKDYELTHGDILFVRSSLKLEGVGWSSLFDGHSEPVTYCGFIIRARLSNHDEFDPRFVTRFCRSDSARAVIISGGAKIGITNINQDILKSFKLPQPGMAEQREISNVFDILDEKLAHHTKKIATYRQLFRTLLHELMTAKTRVHKLDFSTFITESDATERRSI